MKSFRDFIVLFFLYIFNISIYTFKNIFSKNFYRIAYVVEEFFHEDLRGFGGYGISAKRQVNDLNASEDISAEVLLSSVIDNADSEVRIYHDTRVVFRPGKAAKGSYSFNFLKYALKVNFRGYKVLLCTDWYKSYEYIARAMPYTPMIIWIRDPRTKAIWEQILSLPAGEKVVGSVYEGENIIQQIVDNKRKSFQRVYQLSKKFKRKIIFVTAAEGLIPRAEEAYGMENIEADFLPNTVEVPELNGNIREFERPSICFVGRLEPVKRPWVVFEMAKRMPEVDFYVAGTTIYPEIMDPLIEGYRHLKNLKILGLVTGEDKDRLFRQCWALINCSVSEGMPVTFMEAFVHGKPVISCYELDRLLERFGYYTGPLLGRGEDEETLQKFEKSIREFLRDRDGGHRKGQDARKFAEDRFTFDNFKEKLKVYITSTCR